MMERALRSVNQESGQLLAAAGALGEGADRECLRGGLELDVDLVTRASDLVEPKPRELHLHPHAGHTADGPGPDDTGDILSIPKLELLTGDRDHEVALAG